VVGGIEVFCEAVNAFGDEPAVLRESQRCESHDPDRSGVRIGRSIDRIAIVREVTADEVDDPIVVHVARRQREAEPVVAHVIETDVGELDRAVVQNRSVGVQEQEVDRAGPALDGTPRHPGRREVDDPVAVEITERFDGAAELRTVSEVDEAPFGGADLLVALDRSIRVDEQDVDRAVVEPEVVVAGCADGDVPHAVPVQVAEAADRFAEEVTDLELGHARRQVAVLDRLASRAVGVHEDQPRAAGVRAIRSRGETVITVARANEQVRRSVAVDVTDVGHVAAEAVAVLESGIAGITAGDLDGANHFTGNLSGEQRAQEACEGGGDEGTTKAHGESCGVVLHHTR